MTTDNEHHKAGELEIQSKMDVVESTLVVLEEQLKKLDSAGLSIASIHINDAIERLRSDRVHLADAMKRFL